MSTIERDTLPSDPTPHHYKVSIVPDFETFKFTGHVDIKITAEKPQQKITLNYSDLTFVKVRVTPGGSASETEELPAESISLDKTGMKATFSLHKAFQGEATLSIDYTGIINDKLAGFYRSKYTVNGKESYMGTTQFEAVDARQAIPCWDEPAVKAVFEIIITAPSHLMVLSNTPSYKKEVVDDKTRWFFEPTPKMSTYLLAWTIGVFECIERRIQKVHKGAGGQTEETIIRVFTPEGKKSKASFALDVASKVLPLYEEFFGSNYVLPKVDLLAIPDFAAGAMENWGLITYRETALLCDAESSAAQRYYVALVVAHELAHQWFGNLVTMQWWKELWLNESFATYMEYRAVDKLFPEWRVFTQFVHDEVARAFQLDSMRSSHPVEVDVKYAKEIDDIFDAISYSKGGSIIRMAVNFIGEEAFQKGMSEYLKHFAYGNATTKDLWNFLGNAAGKPLAPILEYWTGRQGYPYLIVTSSPDKKTLNITQKRFLATGDVTADEDETVWKVPLLISTPEDGVQRYILEKRENPIPVKYNSWIKVNSEQSAFCRVHYQGNGLLEGLLPAIASKNLSDIDRFSIISDYHAFARAGYCSTVDVLKILSSYVDEDDYTVWCSVVGFEKEIRMLVSSQGRSAVDSLNAFCRNLYSNAMKRLGYAQKPGDDNRLTQLRSVLFDRLVTSEDKEAVAYACKLYAERQKVPIPSDLRYTVYATHVKLNGEPAFQEVKQLAEVTVDAMERTHYLRALASSEVDGVVSQLFQYSLSEKVRSQDVLAILGALASNAARVKAYAEELKQMWPRLGKELPGLILGRALKYLENGADAAVADEMEQFWSHLADEAKFGMTRSFQQGVEGLRNNAKWAARDVKTVVEFLSVAAL
ncbi:aminopeptidase, putative [Trypanosoma brucei brucei TREU927]|uniref:Aminopeptidase n=1 Tax=Trypanosoma brucei brucei (strain 927/4 GUTat10.1) TaxID=185431 RepID=Q386F5_TRYB2|nr:aminopeptidase, putative [Trypanosoma brucei brucei TREU927]EAN79326.1 aminopeptidase, putative [Trypanosoma brucei brucei TREU927]